MRARFLVTALIGFVIALGGFLVWRTAKSPSESTDQPAQVSNAKTVREAVVYLGWLYSGAYAGEALAAKQFDARNGLELKLRQGGIGLDPLRLVSDGTFGVAAADEVIKAIANNDAPLAIVGVLNDDAPAAFVALKSSGIASPQGFPGKRVGILPFGSTRLIYLSLLKELKIPRNRITEVTVTPDLRPFVARSTHDVQPVYVYDEPVTLDKQHVEYNIIVPQDYGVRYKGPVYFTTLATLQNDPALVTSFLRATAEGWRAAHNDPRAAIGALAEVAGSIDNERELEVLRRALPYYVSQTRRLFDSDPETWRPMIDAMQEYEVISRRIEPTTFLYLDHARAATADMKAEVNK